jgi:hypothetical protein
MPPQQPDRLLDVFDDGLDFRAHGPFTDCANAFSDCGSAMQPGFSEAMSRATATAWQTTAIARI